MTDLASPPLRQGAGAPPSPPARRLGRRGWRDSRLLVGILLMLVSVVVGARLFASADRTQGWIAVRRDLPAGHVLTRADLTSVNAHLPADVAGHYYPEARLNDVVGGTLARSATAGDLLAGGDFLRAAPTTTRVVPVIVKAGRAPILAVGDHVDVFVLATTGGGTAAGGAAAGGAAAGTGSSEVLVLHDVEYLGENDLSNGDQSLSLRVPVAVAIDAVAASQTGRVDVVRLDGDAGPAGPTEAPGYGGS